MSNPLSIPPPSRIAIGTAQVGNQSIEIFLHPEWARYFESLNSKVATVTTSTGAAVPAGLDMAGDAEGSVEFIPRAGPAGDQGLQGLPVFLLQDQPEAAEFTPGPPGPQGPKGDPGPALYLMQEPEDNDVFWPIRNS